MFSERLILFSCMPINLLIFFLFNCLRKIKIRLDALQRIRNYLHVLHCAKIKEELVITVCGPLPWTRYTYNSGVGISSSVRAPKNRDRYFAGRSNN